MRCYKRKFIYLYIAVVFIIINSCGSKGGGVPPNPCAGVTITVNGTATNSSSAGNSDGSIAASATGGSGFTFSINSGAFQSSGNFNGLAAAAYTVTAKDSRGCTGTKSFTVSANDVCAGLTFTVGGTPTSSTPCLTTPNGSITVTTSGTGSGFTYNMNGGAFQASATFNNLAANTYTMGAKETGGCVRTASITVNATAAGTLFAAVKVIINTNCTSAGCHSGAAPQGGMDFTQDCQIVANRDRIKVRAVDQANTSNQMPQPPNPALSVANQNAIVNWINAGGQFNN